SKSLLGFSFTRAGADEMQARQDLGAALGAIAAAAEVETALNEATTRFEAELSDEAFAEQQRLLKAKNEIKERLASLSESD
ncbi:MAG: DNA primase, partial [Sphingomonadaceae bacterium]